ncbi:MAG TPA: YwqG family protein [Roseiarcus sp.]|nr:YwqG family protein [Roseiarcus sp.]
MDWLKARARIAVDQAEIPIRKLPGYDPAPPGTSYEEAADLIMRFLSNDRGQALIPLLKRAVRLWPCAHSGDPFVSCLGGLPVLPAGYAWPDFDGEPLLFLGQINFAELFAAIGNTPFPKRGLIQFYGDHDEVMGCGPVGFSAVFYFPDADALQPASAPIDDFLQLPRCGLNFFETIELPDPKSHRIAKLSFATDEAEAYRHLWLRLAMSASHGRTYDRESKLLGWPNLIQRDVGEDFGRCGQQLLVQMGWWHDGVEHHCWGPGGLVYFILNEEAIAEARFEEAVMEMQCT